MKRALILYPHQLFPVSELPEVDVVVMVEDPVFFGIEPEHQLAVHRQKLILHRASMRRYVEEVLWPAKIDVEYVSLDVFLKAGDVFDKLKKAQTIYIFDPVDESLTERLLNARREREGSVTIEFLPSPNFYLKEREIRTFFAEGPKSFLDFYQWQRERFNILITDDFKPEGDEWMLPPTKPHALPEGTVIPGFGVYGSNPWVAEAIEYVGKHFPDNPGSVDFVWPTNHEEAAKWLDDFVQSRIDDFATYHDTLDNDAAWLYHSALSVPMNIGLLSPQQVIAAVLARHEHKPIPLPSLERFVRKLLGHREYLRAQYILRASDMHSSNPLKQQRRLTPSWFSGGLGIPPFDDALRKLHARAYIHDAERTKIVAQLMILAEINPEDVRRWFRELSIDGFDWVVASNVYAIEHFLEPGSLFGVPIAPASALLAVSPYERDEWCNIWDGLYWGFVEKHRDALQKNPDTRVLVQRLDRLAADHKRIIHYRAADFLNTFTQ